MKKACVTIGSLAVAFSATAADFTWKYREDVGTSPMNAASWTDPENWVGGSVPSGKDPGVILSAATNRYIRIDTDVSIYYYTGCAKGYPVLFGEGSLTVTGTRDSRKTCNNVSFFVPLTVSNTYRDTYQRFGGNVAADLKVLGDGLQNASTSPDFRYDWFASSADAVRTYDVCNLALHYSNYSFYAPPKLAEAAESVWRLTKGSPFATRVGTVAHKLPAGTLVSSGALLPEGTFLRRIFPDGTVEFSAAAADDAQEATVRFEAFSPQVTVRVPALTRSVSDSGNGINLNQSEAGDTLKMVVSTVGGNKTGSEYVASRASGFQPGTLVVQNASGTVWLRLNNGRVEFDGKDAKGTDAGLPNGYLRSMDGSVNEIIVTNGVTARVANISPSGLKGTVYKKGTGTLVLPTTLANQSGKVIVSEGALTFPASTDGTLVTIPSDRIELQANGTLKIPPTGARLTKLPICAAGASIVGPGVLVVPDGTDPSTIPVDASVQLLTAAQAEGIDPGDYSWDEIPAATSPLDDGLPVPASWMDASDAASLVTTEEATQLSLLTWKDVRGEGYPQAEAASATKFAQVVTNALGQPHHVYIKPESTTVQANTRSLNYSPEIPKVKAIFKVFNGAGAIICAQNYRWLRPYPSYDTKLFYEVNDEKVLGTFYLNGEVRSRYAGCAYGAEKATDKSQFDPEVLEYHFSETGNQLPTAQRIGYYSGGGDSGRNGLDRICEMILYTNELTFVQRQKICAYLMKKWMHGAEANVDHAAVSNRFVTSFAATGDGTAYPVADGKVGVIDTVAETGALVKTGEGTLYVNDLANTDGSLHVAAGTAKVRSAKLASDGLPGNPYLHFDATDEDSREFVSGSTTKLVRWKDVRGAGYPTGELVAAGKNPTLVADAQNGLPMVDFGSGVWGTDDASQLTGFRYPETDRLYAIFRIAGGQGGGLISSYAGQKLGAIVGGVLHSIPRKEGGMNWFNSYEWVTAAEVSGFALVQNQGTVHSPGATWFRLDGADCAAASSFHPQNSVQLMVLNGYDHIVSDTLGCNYGAQSYSLYRGGNCRDGEVIIYTNTLSGASMKKVEAYLNKKWFGVETQGCRPASTGTLAVDAGATLELVGGAPISATSFSCAGTVEGAVALEDGAELTLVVNEDGSVSALDVSGGVDFSRGGTVRLTGAVRSLAKGSHAVVDAVGEGFGAWTVIADGLKKGWTCSFGLVNGVATLTVGAPGMLLLVR